MDSVVGLGLNRFRNHPLQKDLESHGMSATLMGQEKLTVTLKFTIIKTDFMVIVVTVEGQFKFIEAETSLVLCISFRFLELANQSIVHFLNLLSGLE